MIEIRHILREGLDELVYLSYEGDKDLLERYHVKPNMGLNEAVEETLNIIDETDKEAGLEYYKVINDGKPIGYFVRANICLYSFGINIKYRTKEVLMELWEDIKNIFDGTIICVLYKNNTRAVNWLKKCGMICEETELEDNSIILKF